MGGPQRSWSLPEVIEMGDGLLAMAHESCMTHGGWPVSDVSHAVVTLTL